LLPAAGLGRRLPEIRLLQQSRKQCFRDGSLGGQPSPAIQSRAAPGRERGERIQQHVAGSGVEGDHILRSAARRNRRKVGDSADVENDSSASRMAEEQVIEKRNQRRSLPSGGEIGRTKVTHG